MIYDSLCPGESVRGTPPAHAGDGSGAPSSGSRIPPHG